MSTQSIVKGTALLAGAGLVAKVLGAGYRIFLARLIGNEGIGLYQMAYPIYLIFVSLSTAGVPIAISRIVAEKLAAGDQAGTRRVLRASFVLLLGLGLGSALAMGSSARWLAGNVVVDSRAVYAMWALTPAIFFMSLMAVFRGYFQGWRQMTPSALSQIVEQAVRVSVALILAILLLPKGVEHAAAGAAFGATMGGLAGLIFLSWTFWRKRSGLRSRQRTDHTDSYRSIMKKLIRYTLPISLAVILAPLLQGIDSVIVPARLQSIGYTTSQATTCLGMLGNAWAVANLPLIVTAALSTNMVPAISGLLAKRRLGEAGDRIHEGLRLAITYLVPAAVIVGVFGQNIYRILYGTPGVDILCWFAPAIIFLGLEQVTAGTLQGLGKPNLPLLHFLIGAVVKVLVTVTTTAWPGLNLAGAALGTIAGATVTAGLNLGAIHKLTRAPLPLNLAIVVGGSLMGSGCWYLQRYLNWGYLPEFAAGVAVGGVVYLGSLWLLGGIRRQDIEMVTGLIGKKGAQTG